MISLISVPIILSILLNTGHLPDILNGPGVDDFRSHFQRHFFVYVLFPFISLQGVIFVISPLYLIASYFYLKWLMHSQKLIYDELPDALKKNYVMIDVITLMVWSAI